MFLFVIQFIFFIGLIQSNRIEIDDSKINEIFIFNNIEYYFYDDKVSWNEANALCEATNMRLAILDSNDKAKFIANAMSETLVNELEQMWIGGTKIESRWEWSNGNILADDQQLADDFLYPPWQQKSPEIVKENNRNCLAIDRNSHNIPIFVDLHCSVPRSYICEPKIVRNKTEPQLVKIVSNENTDYFLYKGHLTWFESVLYCRQQGFTLASVDNMQLAYQLARGMLKSRPQLDNVWIGAEFRNGQWIWIENSQELLEIPGEYKSDAIDLNNPDNVIVPSFPPWHQPSNWRDGHNCAVLDRYQAVYPTFIDLKCHYLRSFVCMKRVANTSESITKSSRIRNKQYTFFDKELSWSEAQLYCSQLNPNTTLLTLNSRVETEYITQLMLGENITMKHVWVGGKINDENKWIWIDSNLYIPTKTDPDNYLPWCDDNVDPNMLCLNMDRTAAMTTTIYALECNATQGFVCETDLDPIDFIVENKSTALRITKMPSMTTINALVYKQECETNIGRMWQPNFSNDPELINKLTEHLKEQQLWDHIIYVDGGRYSEFRQKWVRLNSRTDKPEYYNLNTVNKPNHNDCLVGKISSQTNQLEWWAVNCYEFINAEMVCEMVCSSNEISVDTEENEWFCELEPSDYWEYRLLGTICYHQCPNGQVLRGPNQFICQLNGWQHLHNNQLSIAHSVCSDLFVGFENFMELSPSIKSLVFIVDGTMTFTEFKIIKLFIAVLSSKYLDNLKNITVTIFKYIFEMESIQVTALNTTDCDQLIDNVVQLSEGYGKGYRDYYNAIRKTLDRTKHFNKSSTAFVFITNGANEINNYKKIIKKWKKNTTVYSIGTSSKVPNEELIDLSSIDQQTGQSRNILFNSIHNFHTAVNKFFESCTNCKCKNIVDSKIITQIKAQNSKTTTTELIITDELYTSSSTFIPKQDLLMNYSLPDNSKYVLNFKVDENNTLSNNLNINETNSQLTTIGNNISSLVTTEKTSLKTENKNLKSLKSIPL